LVERLQDIVGTDHAHLPQDKPSYSVDGLTPQAVVAPGSYTEVAEVLRYANAERLTVVSRGGGTKMHIGNLPSRYDVALVLRRLNNIVEHEPADLTITCQAGVTLTALSDYLEPFGQLVPLDPALHDRATVGGTLNASAWGPRRFAFGSTRDFTVGMRAVISDGRLVRAGGRVVKNVAGYDLCKLFVGSMGTLGTIVEATFKLAPIPKTEKVIVIGSKRFRELFAIADAVSRRGLAVWACTITSGPDPHTYLLWLWLAGTDRGVERSVTEVEALSSEAKLDSWESVGGQFHFSTMGWACLDWLDNPEWEERGGEPDLAMSVAIRPNDIAQAENELITLSSVTDFEASPTIGAISLRWPMPTSEMAARLIGDVRTIAKRYGGTATVVGCHPDLKQRIDVFGDVPPKTLELMRRIKRQFDPNGILSPGRFVGRI
jgi:glycolate oxidase FAD binding subunit